MAVVTDLDRLQARVEYRLKEVRTLLAHEDDITSPPGWSQRAKTVEETLMWILDDIHRAEMNPVDSILGRERVSRWRRLRNEEYPLGGLMGDPLEVLVAHHA